MVLIAHVSIERQLPYYASNPPSCLADLRCTTTTELADFPFDGHGEPVNAVFAVACTCGTDIFVPLAVAEEDWPRPPFALECTGRDAIR